MKGKIKNILGAVFCLLLAFGFMFVARHSYINTLQPHLESRDILKTGVETSADIIGIRGSGSVTTNIGDSSSTVHYYKIKLSFLNSNGERVEYETGSIYDEEFIRSNNITAGNSVQIKYLGKKAVIKDFVYSFEPTFWISSIGFFAAALLILVSVVYLYAGIGNDNNIKKSGTSSMGTYQESRCFNTGKTNVYCIVYTFTDDSGNVIEAKSRYVYEKSNVEELEKMGSFPIMYKGKKAVIMVDMKQTKNT